MLIKIIFSLFLTVNSFFFQIDYTQSNSSAYIYAIHQIAVDRYVISQISVETDLITNQFIVTKPYDFLFVDHKNNLLLGWMKSYGEGKNEIDIYDDQKKIIQNFIFTQKKRPCFLLQYNKNYFVVSNPNGLFIEVYNNQKKLLKIIKIDTNCLFTPGTFFINDHKLYLLANSFADINREDTPYIYIFDLINYQLIEKIDLGNYCGGGIALSFDKKNKIVYLASLAEGSGKNRKSNTAIMVFSFPSFELIKKIPVEAICLDIIYQKPNFFINTGTNLMVYDIEKQKIIKTFPLKISYMTKLKNKLYCSFESSSPTNSGLAIINLINHKILKIIPGFYGPISNQLE